LSPIRATCPTHLILIDVIIRTILDEAYRSLSPSLCSLWKKQKLRKNIVLLSGDWIAVVQIAVYSWHWSTRAAEWYSSFHKGYRTFWRLY
jgi:hypothetical protein